MQIEKFQLVLQASRCVYQNDFNVARHVNKNFPHLGQHLDVTGDTIELINADVFRQETSEIADKYFSIEQDQLLSKRAKTIGGRFAQVNLHLLL